MLLFGKSDKTFFVSPAKKTARLHLLLAFSRLDALQQLFMLVYAQALPTSGKMVEMCKEIPGMCVCVFLESQRVENDLVF